MKSSKKVRFGFTSKGKKVPLNQTVETPTGWLAYVLNDKCVAVRCFVPKS